MTTRREVDRRLHSLGEIREVMNSMKSLATMETHKLARFLAIQQRQVADIEAMATDLLAHYPDIHPVAAPAERGVILIGAERGFCGDFNDSLARSPQVSGHAVANGAIIAVGHRLATRLDDRATPVVVVDGASATEQVGSVLNQLAQSIAMVQHERGPLALSVLYHDTNGGELRVRALTPPFAKIPGSARQFSHPPLLNLAPQVLFAALLEQYLFAMLSELLYTSLMAENQKRVQHLDSAIRHLDDRREELARRSRVLRQEEIIEEIEVILLNVDAPGTVRRPGPL
jgi:F-type H+-transporting ATPase subunit gamma